MAKVTLTYDLPEEVGDFLIALHGIDYYCVLHEVARELRRFVKYREVGNPTTEEFNRVRQLIRESLEDTGVVWDGD